MVAGPARTADNRDMRSPRPWPVLLALLLSCACGGGGGGGGTIQPSRCISLSGGTAPAPATVVLATGAGSTCGRLVVDVVVAGVPDLFAANLVLSVAGGVARYAGASADGSVLASGGVQVQVEDQLDGGQLVVGITRLADDGVAVTEPRTLVRLVFTPVAAGSFELSLSGTLYGSQTPPQPKTGITFHGATIEVR